MTQYNNILIVGSGGREHSIGWKISHDTEKLVYFAPGNGGTQKNIDICSDDIIGLYKFAKENNSFTIIGPEKPLSLGIVDLFEEDGLPIFGPNKNAAKLESSKVFAKHFMREMGIQTAAFSIFSEPNSAIEYVKSSSRNVVVKIDGLASGKGVFVCDNGKEAVEAINRIFLNGEFGDSGKTIVIEERLFGQEASFIALCDGKSILPLPSSQDHKNILDGDNGPNTGGMGSYSPAPIITEDLANKIMMKIMKPTLSGLNHLGIKFKGFLYAGLMIENESNEPYVLEFNVRMGDPECQSILSRLDCNLLHYLEATVDENLDTMPPIKCKNKFSVCVVMASKGYPGEYQSGKVIHGLRSKINNNVYVFHSGTTRNSRREILTNGGRVLSVTSLDDNLDGAKNKCYSVISKIHWGNNEEYYRRDIALKGIKYVQSTFSD